MKSIRFIHRLRKNFHHYLKGIPAILYTNILLTHNCTQNCLQCTIPEQAQNGRFLSLENYKSIIDCLEDYGTQGITLSGGEPMLHPQLPEIIQYAARKKFSFILLLTTLYASEKVVDRTIRAILDNGISVQCSFDGFGTVADELRGVPDVSRKVMWAMERLDRENKKRVKPVRTRVNVVISQLNLHQIPEIVRYVEHLNWQLSVDLYRWSSANQREVEFLKISDLHRLADVLEIVKNSPVTITPKWLIDGFLNYLQGNYPKFCPYLTSPTFGSRFFIHPNGDLKVCNGKIGNLLEQIPADIFYSETWKNRLKEFEHCPGCWNSCYTISARLSNYFRDLKATRRMISS